MRMAFFLAGAGGLEDPPRNCEQFLKRISFGNSFSRGLYNPPTPGIKKEPPTVILFFMAGAGGLEPATHGFGDRYSTN